MSFVTTSSPRLKQKPTRGKATVSQAIQCRKCSQPVVWAVNHNEKNVLLDAEPVENGDIVMSHLDPGGEMRVRNVRRDEDVTGVPRYTCHFVTCPKAEPRENRPPRPARNQVIDIPEYEGNRDRGRRGDRNSRRPRVGDSRR